VRASIIKAAVLMACCGAVASCAQPAGPQAVTALGSHAGDKAPPANAAPAMYAAVKAAQAGPPTGAVSRARPAPAKSPSAPAAPASPSSVNALPSPVSAQPDSILGVYNGAVPRSYSLVNRFAREVGLQPNVVMYFSAWGDRFRTGFASVARRHGAVPFVELEPYTVSMESIAAGQQDAYLRSYADAVRSFGHPVLIGFAHEMNGFWYRWGYTHTSPSVFRSAWRHVVTVFRRAGASNVRWLWVINGLAAGESPIREWWPGASYVTWVAMDCYYVRPSQTFSSLFGPTIDALRSFTRKPELIAEVGIGSAAGQASKVPGLFAGVRARHLLGFVYYDKAQYSDQYHQNWQIDYDWPAIAAFRRSINDYLR
jgi:mannan endo-1,4-beta-mannosidase